MNVDSLVKSSTRYQKNLAFSTAQAINTAGKEAQRRIRAHMRQVMHIRKNTFMDRLIKIFTFASVGSNRPFLEMGIDNSFERVLLGMFETGGTRVPFVGANVAVPTSVARGGRSGTIPGNYQFSALGLQPDKMTKHGMAYKGAQRTFYLPGTGRFHLGTVFIRDATSRRSRKTVIQAGIRPLYVMRPAQQLRAILDFIEISEQAFNDVFREEFYRRFYRIAQ